MNKLMTLQKRQADLVAEMRTLSDAEGDDGFTGEQTASFQGLQATFEKLKASIGREEALVEAERQKPLTFTKTPEADAVSVGDPNQDEADRQSPAWNSLGEQLVSVMTASHQHPSQWDPRLTPSAATGLSGAVGSEGGFLIGEDQSQELIRHAFENSAVFGGAGYAGVRRIPISSTSNGVKINAVNETSRATGSRWGGIQAYWLETGGTKTSSKPDFRQISLELRKLIGLAYCTDELLQDATALEAVIQEAFMSEFAFMVQDAVINGTGAGQPLGIVGSPCIISVAKETEQLASTIVKENIDNMWSRMWPRGVANSVWFINQDCYPQLFSMAQSVGTGGTPVYLPPGGLSVSPFGTLMGRPVIPIEQCQTVGTAGDILFCDMSQYLFAEKGGIETASSIHVQFTTDETAFRFVYRCDGQPAWRSALTPYKGGSSKTIGPFLKLATRAS